MAPDGVAGFCPMDECRKQFPAGGWTRGRWVSTPIPSDVWQKPKGGRQLLTAVILGALGYSGSGRELQMIFNSNEIIEWHSPAQRHLLNQHQWLGTCSHTRLISKIEAGRSVLRVNLRGLQGFVEMTQHGSFLNRSLTFYLAMRSTGPERNQLNW